MVRQISRNRGLYTAKMAKAIDTPSGFSTWEGSRPGNAMHVGYVQSLRHQERTLNPRVLLHQRGLTMTYIRLLEAHRVNVGTAVFLPPHTSGG
jgi:hypothetical protein